MKKQSKITKIDRKSLGRIQKEANAILAELASRLGVELKATSGQYSNEGFGHFKVEIAVLDGNGEAQTREMESFRALASHYGMEASDLGMAFISRGTIFHLSGLSTRGRKYRYLAKRESDGKTYKFTQRFIVRAKEASRLIRNAAL